jgi:hypothetical protein
MGDLYNMLEPCLVWGGAALAVGFVIYLVYLHFPRKHHGRRHHRSSVGPGAPPAAPSEGIERPAAKGDRPVPP